MENIEPKILNADIGGFDLQYLFYDGDGPDLVFLHAVGFLPWMWHPVAKRLAGKHKIYAPYFCDHKHTEPEEGGLHWLDIASDFAALLKKLKVTKPNLIGHSMGATVCTIATAMLGVNTQKLVLIEPIYLPEGLYNGNVTVDRHVMARKAIRRRNKFSGLEEARDYMRSKKLFENWDDEAFNLYIEKGFKQSEEGGFELVCHPRKEASLFMGGVHTNPWPLLEKIKCPTLIIEGADTENKAFIDHKKIASIFPNGRLISIESTGHLVPMEKPEAVAEAIGGFILR